MMNNRESELGFSKSII